MILNRRDFLKTAGAFSLLPWREWRRSSLNSLTMQLDWQLNAQFAGVMVADAIGLYQQQGLEVNIQVASASLDVPSSVAKADHALGCTEQTLLLEAQAQGLPLVAIATMLQASPLSLMSLPTQPIETLADLTHKRIGVHSDGRKALELVLGVNQLDPKSIEIVEIPYADKQDALLKGNYDAIQCYSLDEPIAFATETGIQPVILKLSDHGFDGYSQVIFTTRDLIEGSPDVIRRFLVATFDGWKRAIADIPDTAHLIATRYAEGAYASEAYQAASLAIVADYLQKGLSPAQLGYISPQRWQQTAQQFQTYGLIKSLPDLEKSLATKFNNPASGSG
ncbi:MAG: ABC transporter substrate-binding protein [Cyanobacteria bacterium P01_D01_bin.44]